MRRWLRIHDGICSLLLFALMQLAKTIDDWRRAVNRVLPRLVQRLRGSIPKLWRLYRRARSPDALPRVRRRAANRVPQHLEEKVVRLHLGWPSLGAGTLRHVLYRLHAVDLPRETVRRIIRRNQRLIAELEREKRRHGRFTIELPRKLWGVDITLVWILGFIPLWIAAIVDYHGSYLIALEPLPWPSSKNLARMFERACESHGTPERVLTDRGPELRAAPFTAMLARLGVEHTLTRPHHPWTNGRVERLFRTFKETVRAHLWVVESRGHWHEVCRDFTSFYNDHRPHQSFAGNTPAETYLGRRASTLPTPTTFFNGRLRWWRFS